VEEIWLPNFLVRLNVNLDVSILHARVKYLMLPSVSGHYVALQKYYCVCNDKKAYLHSPDTIYMKLEGNVFKHI
jgi:hypothetical protein